VSEWANHFPPKIHWSLKLLLPPKSARRHFLLGCSLAAPLPWRHTCQTIAADMEEVRMMNNKLKLTARLVSTSLARWLAGLVAVRIPLLQWAECFLFLFSFPSCAQETTHLFASVSVSASASAALCSPNAPLRFWLPLSSCHLLQRTILCRTILASSLRALGR